MKNSSKLLSTLKFSFATLVFGLVGSSPCAMAGEPCEGPPCFPDVWVGSPNPLISVTWIVSMPGTSQEGSSCKPCTPCGAMNEVKNNSQDDLVL